MTAGEIVTYVGAAIVANSTMIAVLGAMAKRLIDRSLQRDLEQYKSELKRDADLAVEREKAALAGKLAELDTELKRMQHERQIRYARLYEHRFVAVGDLYKALVDAQRNVALAVSILETPAMPPAEERLDKATESWSKAQDCFDRNRPYLPPGVCESVSKIIGSMNEAMFAYAAGRKNVGAQAGLDGWVEAWKQVKGPIREAIDALETSLREMLDSDGAPAAAPVMEPEPGWP